MKKTITRVLSLLTSLMILTTMLPAAALAEDGAYWVFANVSSSGGGWVEIDGSNRAVPGSTVTVIAHPDDGFCTVSWGSYQVDLPNGARVSFTMPAGEVTVTANFKRHNPSPWNLGDGTHQGYCYSCSSYEGSPVTCADYNGDGYCDDCSAQTQPHSHAYTIPNRDDAHHWYECECGDVAYRAAHTYLTPEWDSTRHWYECECGAAGQYADHSYSILHWDSSAHWVQCECGSSESPEAHFGGEATCAQQALCTRCGAAYGSTPAHSYAAEWTITSGGHWRECVCGARGDESAHISSGAATTESAEVCTVCGWEITPPLESHAYELKYDGEKHWQECSICHAQADEEAHTGGTATCAQQAVCSVCGLPYGELAPHTGGAATCAQQAVCSVCSLPYGELADNHSYAWKATETGHLRECALCLTQTEQGDHTGGTATCTEKAVCSVCSLPYGELAPHTGGAATCAQQAVCSVCGLPYGELAPHTGGAASCAEQAVCAVCRLPYGEVNPLAHRGGAATCQSPAVCELCGQSYGGKNPDGHQYEWKATESGHLRECALCQAQADQGDHTGGAASCTEKAVCELCGQSYGAAPTHSVPETPEYDADNHWFTCTVCGEKQEENHWGGFAPTCATQSVCSVCQQPYGQKDPNSHNYTRKFDESGHWDECPCGAKTEGAGHGFGFTCTPQCGDCGYTRLAAHEYELRSGNDERHIYRCKYCNLDLIGSIQPHSFSNSCDPDCDCGYTREVTGEMHTFGSYKDCGDGYHVQYCRNCGLTDESSREEHIKEKVYDDTHHWPACRLCEWDNPDHKEAHSFDGIWTETSDLHWLPCTGCQLMINFGRHDYMQQFDQDDHWQECSVCRRVTGKETHNFTVCEDGSKSCPCGYTEMPSPSDKHEHDMGYDVYSIDRHWKVCNGCGDRITPPAEHTFDGCGVKCLGCHYVRNDPHTWGAPCDTTCNLCDATREVHLGHDLSTAWSADESGHFHNCARCGEQIGKATHIYYDKAATCSICFYSRFKGEIVGGGVMVSGIGLSEGAELKVESYTVTARDVSHAITATAGQYAVMETEEHTGVLLEEMGAPNSYKGHELPIGSLVTLNGRTFAVIASYKVYSILADENGAYNLTDRGLTPNSDPDSAHLVSTDQRPIIINGVTLMTTCIWQQKSGTCMGLAFPDGTPAGYCIVNADGAVTLVRTFDLTLFDPVNDGEDGDSIVTAPVTGGTFFATSLEKIPLPNSVVEIDHDAASGTADSASLTVPVQSTVSVSTVWSNEITAADSVTGQPVSAAGGSVTISIPADELDPGATYIVAHQGESGTRTSSFTIDANGFLDVDESTRKAPVTSWSDSGETVLVFRDEDPVLYAEIKGLLEGGADSRTIFAKYVSHSSSGLTADGKWVYVASTAKDVSEMELVLVPSFTVRDEAIIYRTDLVYVSAQQENPADDLTDGEWRYCVPSKASMKADGSVTVEASDWKISLTLDANDSMTLHVTQENLSDLSPFFLLEVNEFISQPVDLGKAPLLPAE